MLDFIRQFFQGGDLSPHGVCLLWRPELIGLHVLSDAVIAIAYFSIPIVLVQFIRRRPDVGFGWVFWCFAAFITACGTTHLISIWTLWRPDYAAEGLIKAATAAASIATAGALWPLLPVALRIPSPAQLKGLNADLARRVEERDAALADLTREIADREQVEAMLRQSQKMEALGQLTAGVAHDFNNLLSIIMLNVERIQRDIAADSRAARSAEASLEATRRAAQLTAQMLTYARQSPLHAATVDVVAFAHRFELLAREAVGTERRLLVQTDSGPLLARVDESEFTAALLNLVVNARDATPPGRIIRLEVRRGAGAGEAARTLDVSVTDEGEGMPPEVLARAFDPFFTTKPPGRGSGLGLSQVLGFARSAGGFASIDSEPGRGTRVSVQLPVLEMA